MVDAGRMPLDEARGPGDSEERGEGRHEEMALGAAGEEGKAQCGVNSRVSFPNVFSSFFSGRGRSDDTSPFPFLPPFLPPRAVISNDG